MANKYKMAMIEVGKKTLKFPNKRGVFINKDAAQLLRPAYVKFLVSVGKYEEADRFLVCIFTQTV